MERLNISRKELDAESLLKEEAILFGIKGEDKIDAFEKYLSNDVKFSDNVPDAVDKIVKAAICAEFGEEMLDKKFAENMVRTISKSIMAENELRKQALLIMDRFAKPDIMNA